MTATLDWLGCATFRLSLGRLVLFLDAYIDRVPAAPQVGIAVDEIDRADFILVGHSHFDHVYGAERIAARTGATIIGSYETVRIMHAQGIPEEQLIPVAGGEKLRLAADVTVDVYPSQHSCVWSHGQMDESDQVCIGDLGVTLQEQRERFAQLAAHFGTLGDDVIAHLRISAQSARGDGGALIFHLETPEGSLLYQDTSGHWSGILRDRRPDVAILAAAGRGNIDGEPIQGSLAQFVARQVDLVRPRRYLLSHHDDWLPGFSRAIDTKPIRDEAARVYPPAEFVELTYLSSYPLFEGLRR
jgi:L-ascorbate metabolism protein UlaG (beta-lactamase superfamily)